MSDNAERLRSWAQNEEMVDDRYTEHGRDCLNAADEIERLRNLEAEAIRLDLAQALEKSNGRS